MNPELILSFVLLLNPFALFLYLKDVMEALSNREFAKVMLRASIISFIICLVFAAFGDEIFMNIFHVNFESFRIFGGVVLFSFSFLFIVRGHNTIIQVKPNIDEIANELAMPFMVGAGAISLSIIIGNNAGNYIWSAAQIGLALVINLVVIFVLKYLKDYLTTINARSLFDKVMGMLVRLLAFMVGAIGVQMMATGIKEMLICK